MGVLINIGKFLLGAILKVIAIILAVLLIWLVICIFTQNGFKDGIKAFLDSKVTLFILSWVVASWMGILSGDVQKTVIGIVMFFAPIILLSVATPNPDIELYDSSGNLWKLRRG